MKAACAGVIAFAAGACAFAPITPAVPRSSTALQAKTLEEIGGYSAETGNKPFDPLNIAAFVPPERMRQSELHNGRVAMLAVVGWAFPELVGKFASEDVTSTHALDALSQADPRFWTQFIILCGIVEANMYRHYQINNNQYPFFDPLNLYPKDKAGQQSMELKELKNGRAAMIAFAAMLAHATIPGSVPGFALPF
uniref:light-harvesting protein XLH2 n=1 Tax=Tribonema minus TaxID=303371 RepID=UPI003FA615AD|eukprot:TRINITY_DN5379_c0_g1_i3.p1 TRINITY_DN5379_c0_g1~~TRINITY_DN5379_c0_g1_i3.p1  ORF type:complete len:195 (+),score=64.20 TRINITY_DN5379_c0_g1_i3:86-670(+)